MNLLAALLLLAPLPLRAESGRTAAQTLQRPIGARPIGMGEAFTAVEGGVASLGYNPGALARMERPEFETTYTRGVIDDHFSFLGYAHPTKFGVVTAGFMYYDAGSIGLNLSNGTQRTVKAQQDLVGMGGVSLKLGDDLTAGATAKVFRFELAEQARAGGLAADLGALWRTPLSGLSLGASLLNAGPDVRFEHAGDPLPMSGRAGAAYRFSLAGSRWARDAGYGFSDFLLTLDGVKTREQKAVVSTGFEMGMPLGLADHGAAAIRVGYLFGRDLDSLTLGFGLRQGRISFDYALGVLKKVGNAHHLSIGCYF